MLYTKVWIAIVQKLDSDIINPWEFGLTSKCSGQRTNAVHFCEPWEEYRRQNFRHSDELMTFPHTIKTTPVIILFNRKLPVSTGFTKYVHELSLENRSE